jgi:hypothetical protein
VLYEEIVASAALAVHADGDIVFFSCLAKASLVDWITGSVLSISGFSFIESACSITSRQNGTSIVIDTRQLTFALNDEV